MERIYKDGGIQVIQSIENVEQFARKSIDAFDEMDWKIISRYCDLSEEFIEHYQDKLDWSILPVVQRGLSVNFFKKYKDKLSWSDISGKRDLDDEFIREFQNELNWEVLSYNYPMTEEFINEFADRLYWTHVSANQLLTESLIEKYKDRVDWYYIVVCQDLSYEFILKHIDKLNLRALENTRMSKLTTEEKEQILELIRLQGNFS